MYSPPKARNLFSTLLLIFCLCETIKAVDIAQCLIQLQNGTFGSIEGAVNYYGEQVFNMSLAYGLPYSACEQYCGHGHQPFDWGSFSSQIAGWLLPWFALISQLPYGADDSLKNFESMILAVGSPMLAAYSLALSVTGNRWLVERLRRSEYPNDYFAAYVMSSLQQVSFNLPKDHVLASLIVRRENDQWWRKLSHGLDYTGRQWTVRATASMGFVVLLYIFTWINTLTGEFGGASFPASQNVGSIWLALLAIIICTLELPPKSDIRRIKKAIQDADKLISVNGDPTIERREGTTITVSRAREALIDEDIVCPTPIFFPARFTSWFRASLKVTNAYHAASQHSKDLQASEVSIPDPDERPLLVAKEPLGICGLQDESLPDLYSYDFLNIHIKSALLAFFLQWGTGGASVVAMYLTPKRGLGCFSASHLLYLWTSTLIWFLSALSGVLSHVYVSPGGQRDQPGVLGGIAVILRQTSKIFAALNTGWILISSSLEMAGFYISCYCKANAIIAGRGDWGILGAPPDEEKNTRIYWVAGMTGASATAVVFLIAIIILIKRPKLESTLEHDGNHLME